MEVVYKRMDNKSLPPLRRTFSLSRTLRTFSETWSLERSMASRIADEMWGFMRTLSGPCGTSVAAQ